ncbi:MAG: type II toxin-antitoxin system VapC family toxin, partial [Deltaproteobacteria bacterium]|nr:type II toxin-antitoxin system VapC family toxin [Deltaproteobacteria bacterium]
DPDWSAPFLWRSEFRNVLALYLRKGLINFDNALKLQEEAESLMERNEFSVSTPHILALVNESKCSAYDCEFVTLAHQLNTKLITQDKRILSEFPSVALNIDDFIIQKP